MRHVEVGERLEGREDVQRPCYGMAIVKAETGRGYSDDTLTGSPNVQDDLSSGGLGHFGLHHNFRVVLWALSLSRRQIKSLSAHNWPTVSPEFDLCGYIDLEAVDSLTGYYADGLRAAFRRLTKLSLSVSWWKEAHPDLFTVGNIDSWLPSMVNLAPQLRTLIIWNRG